MVQTAVPDRALRASADATRERILAAALDLFADKSFEGASTRQIALRAGVTQGLLNYHFSSKDELWRAAVDGLFGELTLALSRRADGLRGVDELTVGRLLIREFVYFCAARPQLHRIITQEGKSDSSRLDWLVDRHVRPIFEDTTAHLGRLVEHGHLPDIPAVHLYYIITGASATMFVLSPECQRLAGVDPQASDVIEAHADSVVRLLFGP